MAQLGKSSTLLLRAIEGARQGNEMIFVYEGGREMHDYYDSLCRHLCSMKNVRCQGGRGTTLDIGAGTLRFVQYRADNPPPSLPHIIIDHRVAEATAAPR